MCAYRLPERHGARVCELKAVEGELVVDRVECGEAEIVQYDPGLRPPSDFKQMGGTAHTTLQQCVRGGWRAVLTVTFSQKGFLEVWTY
jgi:hypothetical protein